MNNTVTVLIYVVLLAAAKSANNQTSLPHSSVREVLCILFSSFYDCSDNFNKTDEVYNRYSDVCTNVSLGSRYLHTKCTRNTMEEIVQFFEKQTMPAMGDNITRWRHLKKNPKKIVNFVMSTMLNNKIYKRPMRKIHKAIHNVKLGLRSGSTSSTKPSTIPDDLILEFSCSVFSMARYCSHQLDHCNQTCYLLERVCTRLSFVSQLLSLSCIKDTISVSMALLRSNDDKYAVSIIDNQSLWKEILTESPQVYINKLTTTLQETYYSLFTEKQPLISSLVNNGTVQKYCQFVLFLVSVVFIFI